jgi:hypothetical protein
MLSVINGSFIPDKHKHKHLKPDQPFAKSWKELFDFLLA